jgi:hypothetical protein
MERSFCGLQYGGISGKKLWSRSLNFKRRVLLTDVVNRYLSNLNEIYHFCRRRPLNSITSYTDSTTNNTYSSWGNCIALSYQPESSQIFLGFS